MGNHPGNRAGGDEFHRLLAGRVSRLPRGIDWRETRDLSLLLTVSTAAPLAVLAVSMGMSAVATIGLTALTAGAAGWMIRVLRREFALDLIGGRLSRLSGRGPSSSRWRTAALRLIPARHQQPEASSTLAATASSRIRTGRPGRRKP